MDVRMATSSKEAIAPYQDYYRQLMTAKKLDYDYIVEVRSEISDVFKGKENNIKINSKVILKDANGKAIIRSSGKVTAIIPPPPFNGNDLIIDRVDVKQNFSLSATDLQDAFKKSVSLAFEETNEQTINAADRPTINSYDTFINKAISYRLLAPANFAKTRFKFKIQGFYTLTKSKPAMLTRIGSNKGGMLNLKETKITDIDFGIGIENIHHSYRFQRNFRIGIDMADIPSSDYFIKGIVYADNSILGTGSRGPVKLIIKKKDEKENGVLKFRNEDLTTTTLSQYNRSLGRIFCPFGKLEGTVFGKQLIVQSSMVSINTLEVLINGKLVGLITHPVTTREYLRKDKNIIPFVVYIDPQLTLEDESLVLQAFQFNQLSYLLKDYQDNIVHSLANRKP